MTISVDSMTDLLRAQLAYRGLVLTDLTGRPLADETKIAAIRDLAELAVESVSPLAARTIPRETTRRIPRETLDHAVALSRIL